jgi:hypothetical protein
MRMENPSMAMEDVILISYSDNLNINEEFRVIANDILLSVLQNTSREPPMSSSDEFIEDTSSEKIRSRSVP